MAGGNGRHSRGDSSSGDVSVVTSSESANSTHGGGDSSSSSSSSHRLFSSSLSSSSSSSSSSTSDCGDDATGEEADSDDADENEVNQDGERLSKQKSKHRDRYIPRNNNNNDDDDDDYDSRRSKNPAAALSRHCSWRQAVFWLVVALFVAGLVALFASGLLQLGLLWVAGVAESLGFWAYAIVFGILQLVALPFVSGLTATLILAGFLFGWWALLVAWPALWLGAVWANAGTRFFCADRALGYLERKRWFHYLHEEIARRSFVSVLLLRWSPLHFGAVNAIFGVVTVPFLTYIGATVVALLDVPLYVSVGTSIRSIADITDWDDTSPVAITVLCVQIVVTFALLVGMTVLSKKVAKRLKMGEDDSDSASHGDSDDSDSERFSHGSHDRRGASITSTDSEDSAADDDDDDDDDSGSSRASRDHDRGSSGKTGDDADGGK